jgi:MoxR-like ATPase
MGLVNHVIARLRGRMQHAVRGREDVIDLVIIALLADGHVLLEDFPGSGKTTLARALGDSITSGADDTMSAMRRVQFTPDLLPSDITGTTIFDPATSAFHFRAGPVFTHILLADEINRTSPKVQAALLEAMGEKQATIDNETHRLDDLFFVIATQNPLDLAGTFPLPTAQLDRFLFKIRMVHIAAQAELDVLRSRQARRESGPPTPPVHRDEIVQARAALEAGIHVAPSLLEALVQLAHQTRHDERVRLGISTRALVQAVPALQARAAMEGRAFVLPADLEHLTVPLFAHRMELAPGIDDAAPVLRDCLRPVLETLARQSMQRAGHG